MPLQIYLNATLRKYVPDYDSRQGVSLEAPMGTTVAQLVARLGMSAKEANMILVDGHPQSIDFVLQGHERLEIYPPMAGA